MAKLSLPSLARPNRHLSSLPLARWMQRVRATWGVYLVLLPVFVILGLFSYYPAYSAIVHSFFDWEPGFTSTFIGLHNYVTIAHFAEFWQSFGHVAWLFLFGVTAAWIVPLIAAECVITLSSPRWQFIFRTLLIVPLAFPAVVTLLLWDFMYDPESGVINTTLRALHLGNLAQNWLGDPHLALLSLMLIGLPWIASTPFLLFLAGLQSIPSEVLDAAAIDGAGRFRRIFLIDIPLLTGQIRLLLVLAIIGFVQFAVPVSLLTQGGPAGATTTPVTLMITVAFGTNGELADWGLAATMSTFLFLVTLVLSLIVLFSNRSVNQTARL